MELIPTSEYSLLPRVGLFTLTGTLFDKEVGASGIEGNKVEGLPIHQRAPRIERSNYIRIGLSFSSKYASISSF